MTERILGQGFSASEVSYGAMGLSEFYGPALPDEEALAVLEKAFDLGVTMFDTADMYGLGHNEELIGRFLKSHPADLAAGRLKVATKFGIERHSSSYERRINNSPEYIRKSCEASLKRLGVECLDLYYVHRLDAGADVAETVGTLSQLVREGKVAHIGLCEVSAKTLALAHQVHPITAVQSEYSLWSRDVETDILPLCRRLGIGFVAYSPLGRGFLSGRYAAENLADNDFRRSNPRFQGDNLRHNLSLLDTVKELATEHGCTPAQIALAWLLTKPQGGNAPSQTGGVLNARSREDALSPPAESKNLVAIPGTRHIDRLEENCAAANVALSAAEVARLERTFKPEAVQGARYTAEGMKGVGV